jgi:3D (Asp-Asp-Asp) domain-containing protein
VGNTGYRVTMLVTILTLCGCRPAAPPPAPLPPPPQPPRVEAPTTRPFEATAYTIEGETASGTQTHKGIVAADPRILPLGSRIRVHGTGAYDGEYTVADTGREIKGHEIDIYIRNDAEAKRFGRKAVSVELLEPRSGSQ